jgi:hypothetical protein
MSNNNTNWQYIVYQTRISKKGKQQHERVVKGMFYKEQEAEEKRRRKEKDT